MTIYAFGEGDFLTALLQGIAHVMSPSGGYYFIVRISVLLGFFILLWQLVFSFNITQVALGTLKHYFFIIMIWFMLFLPKADVSVEDLVNSGNPPVPVPSVPYGIALLGSTFSKIEKGMAELFEGSFYTSNPSFAYTQNGFSMPLIAVDTLKDATWTDTYMKRTMNAFLEDCFFIDILTGDIDLEQVMVSPNLWAMMSPQFSASHATKIYTAVQPTGYSDSCLVSYNTMTTELAGAIQNATEVMSATIGMQVDTKLKQWMDSVIGTANTLDTAGILQQAITSNMLSKSMASSALQNGLNGDAFAYATAIAEQQQRTSWAIGGELSKKYIPIIRQVMLSLLYGAFPLVFLLMFLPWGTTYLKLYATLFMWLAMWAPLYTILNFIIQTRVEGIMTPTQGLYSLGNMPYIYQSTYDLVSLSGWLSWTVPMFAFAIAKGSEYALTNVISGITSSSQQAASSAASNFSGPNAVKNIASGMGEIQSQLTMADTYSSGAAASAFHNAAKMSAYAQFGTDTLQKAGAGATKNAVYSDLTQGTKAETEIKDLGKGNIEHAGDRRGSFLGQRDVGDQLGEEAKQAMINSIRNKAGLPQWDYATFKKNKGLQETMPIPGDMTGVFGPGDMSFKISGNQADMKTTQIAADGKIKERHYNISLDDIPQVKDTPSQDRLPDSSSGKNKTLQDSTKNVPQDDISSAGASSHAKGTVTVDVKGGQAAGKGVSDAEQDTSGAGAGPHAKGTATGDQKDSQAAGKGISDAKHDTSGAGAGPHAKGTAIGDQKDGQAAGKGISDAKHDTSGAGAGPHAKGTAIGDHQADDTSKGTTDKKKDDDSKGTSTDTAAKQSTKESTTKKPMAKDPFDAIQSSGEESVRLTTGSVVHGKKDADGQRSITNIEGKVVTADDTVRKSQLAIRNAAEDISRTKTSANLLDFKVGNKTGSAGQEQWQKEVRKGTATEASHMLRDGASQDKNISEESKKIIEGGIGTGNLKLLPIQGGYTLMANAGTTNVNRRTIGQEEGDAIKEMFNRAEMTSIAQTLSDSKTRDLVKGIANTEGLTKTEKYLDQAQAMTRIDQLTKTNQLKPLVEAELAKEGLPANVDTGAAKLEQIEEMAYKNPSKLNKIMDDFMEKTMKQNPQSNAIMEKVNAGQHQGQLNEIRRENAEWQAKHDAEKITPPETGGKAKNAYNTLENDVLTNEGKARIKVDDAGRAINKNKEDMPPGALDSVTSKKPRGPENIPGAANRDYVAPTEENKGNPANILVQKPASDTPTAGIFPPGKGWNGQVRNKQE